MADPLNEQNYYLPVKELDPELWQNIRTLAKNFPPKPSTLAGDNVFNSIILNEETLLLFENYPQLSDLLSVLIYLYEVEAGATISQSDFFQKPENQLLLVKAFGYFAEGELKQENYHRYQNFFNKLTEQLKKLENLIKNNSTALPNILGSLILALNAAIHTLPGASTINLKPQAIKSFLLSNMEFAQQYQAIFENFQLILSRNPSSQKPTL